MENMGGKKWERKGNKRWECKEKEIYSNKRQRDRGAKLRKRQEWKARGVGEVTKGGSRREERTQRRSARRMERTRSEYKLSCIPCSFCTSCTVFLACWHAEAHRDWVSRCLPCPLFVCLPEVSTLNMQPDGNCSRSLPYYSSGTYVSITDVLFLRLLLSFSSSSLFLCSPLFFFSSSLPAFVCSTASIHNSSIAPVTRCVEDSRTDSQAETVRKTIRGRSSGLSFGTDVWISIKAFHWL